MRLVACLAGVVLLLSVTLSATPASADDPEAAENSPWSVRFEPWEFGSGAGIARKLSDRWELGIELSGSHEDGDRDADREDSGGGNDGHSTDDDDSWSLQVRPELRRWWTFAPIWKGFLGLRASYSTRQSTQHGVSENDRYREVSESQGVGCSLSGGVETPIWRALSLQAAFTPVGISHSWSESKRDYHQLDGDEWRYVSHEKAESATISYSLAPQVYLVIRW